MLHEHHRENAVPAAPPAATQPAAPLHVALVAWMVAGIRTQYENTAAVFAADPTLRLSRVEVFPGARPDLIERVPALSPRTKGVLRTYTSMSALYRVPAPDVVWTQILPPVAPYLFSVAALRHTPVVFTSDMTPRLLASFGTQYAEQVAGPPLKRRAVDAIFGAAARRCAAVACWSSWAARSFERGYGVRPDHIRVLPPGVDISWWEPLGNAPDTRNRVRLLFVGADFARKGGELLLDVWRRRFADRCELHLVTKHDVPPEQGLFVYRDFMPNDERLRRLYQTCDALVLPTLGDCFSLASIEAMATGLPVITSAVGGIPDIVDDGTTGFLLAPGDGKALADALEALVGDPTRRLQFGAAGRRKAVECFDAAKNGAKAVDLLREVAGKR